MSKKTDYYFIMCGDAETLKSKNNLPENKLDIVIRSQEHRCNFRTSCPSKIMQCCIVGNEEVYGFT